MKRFIAFIFFILLAAVLVGTGLFLLTAGKPGVPKVSPGTRLLSAAESTDRRQTPPILLPPILSVSTGTRVAQ